YFPNGLSTTAASGSAASGSAASGSGSELSATPADDSYCVPAATLGFTPEEKQELGDKTPVVAIVDDGVDYTHEDLKNMMWNNPFSKKKLPGKHGYDFALDKDDPMPYEGDDHATHIAGYIAAESDNGIGMAGICKNVRIMSCKTFDGNDSSYDADFAAYEYIYKAKKLGVNVVAVNCSFGNGPTEEEDPDMTEALAPYDIAANKLGSLGIITVFASGNSSDDFDVKKYGLPSQLKSPYIVKVGASTYAGTPAYFSNYGATTVDLFAPGDALMSCAGDDNYLPESYTPEQRKEKCLYYNDFSGGSVDSVKTVTDLFPSKKSAVTLSHSDWDFVGDKKNGSLRAMLPYMRNTDSRAYNMYFDITDRNIDLKKQYRLSFDYLEETDGIGNWSHLQRIVNLSHALIIFTRGDRTYLVINLRELFTDTSKKIGSAYLFDNLSISVADPDETQFGRYEYSGGTSFSAPIVVAAIARLRMLYPDDNAATIRAKLMASTRKLDALTGKCICNGTLDMSKFESVADIKAEPFKFKVEDIVLSEFSTTLKAGKSLKLTATVLPVYATNQELSWSVSNSKWATVSNNGVVTAKSAGIGHTVNVIVKPKDGSKVKSNCKIKIIK
ncbi:MAG: S8 family serine peptidase, partial [Eubacterium sp.]|nr:S8 family serine peptidase [Eubacterium sp.]